MTDIVEKLRSAEVFIETGGMISPVAYEAADEIERLRKAQAITDKSWRDLFEQNKRMVEALEDINILSNDYDKAVPIARAALGIKL